jgi:hypothetical protein
MTQSTFDPTAPLEQILDDGSCRIRCSDREQAHEITGDLYSAHNAEHLRIEHKPVTLINDGNVFGYYVDLIVRHEYYEPDVGWCSSDKPSSDNPAWDVRNER